MIANRRKSFNQNFSLDKHQEVKRLIEEKAGMLPAFRLSESPIFISDEFRIDLLDQVHTFVKQINILDNKELEKLIPKNCYVPNTNEVPDFLTIDFGICTKEDGKIYPALIELQGFPSIYAYQYMLAKSFQEVYPELNEMRFYLGDYTKDNFVNRFKEALLAGHKEENVILMELFPEKQKTRIDFALSEKYFGIKTVSYTDIKKEGKEIFYLNNGKKTKINRIFNRFIFDEFFRFPDLKPEFNLREEIDVEWFTHPNWFFMASKSTMPLLSHPNLPSSFYVSNFKDFDNINKYVLKPLFSFAGAGVNLNPTKEDLEKVDNPNHWMMQQKVSYAPIFKDINGDLAKAEIRVLCMKPKDKSTLEPVMNIVRMTKSAMVNVDHNKKDQPWTGSSVAFFE